MLAYCGDDDEDALRNKETKGLYAPLFSTPIVLFLLLNHVLSTEHSRTFVLLNHVRVFHYRYLFGLTPVSRANFQRLIHHLPKL
jgi:hypothetical protein